MVGDGLNDAPALAAAHASLSPASAADISQRAADFVFQGEKLVPVVELLATAKARATMALQNFGVAFGYNLVFGAVCHGGLCDAADRRHRHVDLLDPRHPQCRAACRRERTMTALAWLVPAALLLGGLGLRGVPLGASLRPIRGSGRRGLPGAGGRSARSAGAAQVRQGQRRSPPAAGR